MGSTRFIRLKFYVLLTTFLSVFAWFTHLCIVDRKAVLRTVYPIKAQFSKLTVDCHGNALWVEDFIKLAINENGGVANQVAYIDGTGAITDCVSGWSGAFPWSRRITRETRFRYASNTKIITAAAVLRLVSQGLLDIEATLGELFPELTFDKNRRLAEVSVKHLLTHRAGFNREGIQGDPMFQMGQRPWCPYDLSQLNGMNLSHHPGAKTIYSNLGYCLLGAIIEKVTTENYKSHVERSFALSSYDIRFIDGPYYDDEPWYDLHNELFYLEDYYELFDFNAIASSAGLSGNARALASIINLILGEDSGGELLSSVPGGDCDTNSFRGCYGYAFYRYYSEDLQSEFLIHEGYLPGSSSLVVVRPQGDLLVWLSGGKAFGGFVNAEAMLTQMLHLMASSK